MKKPNLDINTVGDRDLWNSIKDYIGQLEGRVGYLEEENQGLNNYINKVQLRSETI